MFEAKIVASASGISVVRCLCNDATVSGLNPSSAKLLVIRKRGMSETSNFPHSN